MDVSLYTQRINYEGSLELEPSLATLRALHFAHLLTVPFENLDIHVGRPIRLDRAALGVAKSCCPAEMMLGKHSH